MPSNKQGSGRFRADGAVLARLLVVLAATAPVIDTIAFGQSPTVTRRCATV